MSECRTCIPVECGVNEDIELFSLQSVFPYILNCPVGYNCDAEQLRMVCCGDEISVAFPPGTTDDERTEITNALVAECARRKTFCGEIIPPHDPEDPPPPPPVFYYNTPQVGFSVCPDGNPFSYTVRAGTFLGTSQSEANAFAKAYAGLQALQHRICLSDLVNGCQSDGTYQSYIRAFGNYISRAPYSDQWSIVSGSIPTGLTFHGGALTGGRVLLNGTPTAEGVFTFKVRIVLGTPVARGDFMEKTYTIEVLFAERNRVYSEQLTKSPCSAGKFAITGGLPSGLTMTTDGLVTGTPTELQACAFTSRFNTAG